MLNCPSCRTQAVGPSQSLHCLLCIPSLWPPSLKHGGPASARSSKSKAACGPLAHFPAVLLEAISLGGAEGNSREREGLKGLG